MIDAVICEFGFVLVPLNVIFIAVFFAVVTFRSTASSTELLLLIWINDNACGDISRLGAPPLAEAILIGLVCEFAGIPSSLACLSTVSLIYIFVTGSWIKGSEYVFSKKHW